MRREISRADVLYLNSFFSPHFTILPLALMMLGIAPRRPILLAPRGELNPGALVVKSWKKRPIGWLLGVTLRRFDLVWHASSLREQEAIEAYIGDGPIRAIVQSDPPPAPQDIIDDRLPNTLTVAFLARMVPIKNFEHLIEAAKLHDSHMRIRVVGQIEDGAYWNKCRRLMHELPVGIHVEVLGHVGTQMIEDVLESAHAMVLPTRGENFGHAIAEALAVGCPVIVPDTTMWTDVVSAGGGEIIDLSDPKVLARMLNTMAREPIESLKRRRRRANSAYRTWHASRMLESVSLFTAAKSQFQVGKGNA